MRQGVITLTAILFLIPVLAAAQNSPPVADAGEDQSMIYGQTRHLDGTGSYDPDEDPIVSWQWTLESAPPESSGNVLARVDWPTALFTPDVTGTFVVSLVVGDGTDLSEPDFATITVALNQPPVAIASADRTSGFAPLTVHFDGSQSYDPEGEELTYRWSFGDGEVVYEMSPTHLYHTIGFFQAQLLVTDDQEEQDNDTVEITVSLAPTPVPSISFGGLALLAGLVLGSVALAVGRRQRTLP